MLLSSHLRGVAADGPGTVWQQDSSAQGQRPGVEASGAQCLPRSRTATYEGAYTPPRRPPQGLLASSLEFVRVCGHVDTCPRVRTRMHTHHAKAKTVTGLEPGRPRG